MTYTVKLGKQPEKFLKKLDTITYQRILVELRELEQNPFPTDVKRLVGKKGRTAYRTRVGPSRVEYVVLQETKEIIIFKIEERSKAY